MTTNELKAKVQKERDRLKEMKGKAISIVGDRPVSFAFVYAIIELLVALPPSMYQAE